MRRWQWLGALVFPSVMLMTSSLSAQLFPSTPSRLEYPPRGPCSCVPNVMHFGHYEPQWRAWPGELRLEQVNSRAVIAEPLPTPKGQKIVPPPKAAGSQGQPSQGQQPPGQQPPGQPSPGQPPQGQQPQAPVEQPEEPSVLPPGSTLRPPEGTLLPTTPKGSENKPSTEGALPGLEEPPATPPAKKPPAGKPSATPSAKPPAEKPKSSMWENGPKLGNMTDVTVDSPLPENCRYRQPDTPQQETPPIAAKSDRVDVPPNDVESERNTSLAVVSRADFTGTAGESKTSVEPAAYASTESSVKSSAANQAALPAVALDGYCPVELNRNGRWVVGDLRWTVVRDGRIYRLSGTEQRRLFLADPERYMPVNSGNDVVRSAKGDSDVPGKTANCAIYNNRLYMFSSQTTQAEFNRNPGEYAAERPLGQ